MLTLRGSSLTRVAVRSLMLVLGVSLAVGSASASASAASLEIVGGRNPNVVPGPATGSYLIPSGVAVDSSGNVYVADGNNATINDDVVEEVTPSGTPTIIAGKIGESGAPTPGPATGSELDGPTGVAVDSTGNVYIADCYNNVVEKVTPSGTLSIIAGKAGQSGAPTPGPAISSELDSPTRVAVDSSGNVYIADSGNAVVEKITPSGTLSIIAGKAGQSGTPTPGPATSSDLGVPDGLAVDSSGNLFIDDASNDVVEKVTPSGTLSIVAGKIGQSGAPTPGPATSSDLDDPTGVTVDATGNLYVADTYNADIEKVTPSGTLSIIAGTGHSGAPTPGPATGSDLGHPFGVAIDSTGSIYIADTPNDMVEKVTSSGTLSIFAGFGAQSGVPTPGPAISSDLDHPAGVAVDSSGNLYIADTYNDVVEKITPSGTLSVIAGDGRPGAPTPGPATATPLGGPNGVAVDSSGNLYIADGGNAVVEKVTPSGTLSIIAGKAGQFGSPTPGPATSSDLGVLGGLAVDSSGNLYIADAANGVVEKVTTAGILSIIATSSALGVPAGVAVDSFGNLYVADSGNDVVEKVTPSGTLSIVAGKIGQSGVPSPGPATSSDLDNPGGVAVDSSGNLYVADSGNDVVEKVTPSGTLSILAGNGQRDVPTAGPATSSALDDPNGVAVDSTGSLFIADTSNNVVEEVSAGSTAPSVTLGVSLAGSGSGSVSSTPSGIACGSACSAQFSQGKQVTLTEAPTPGSTFAGWSGGECSATASTCQLTLNAAENVTATFNTAQAAPVTPPETGTAPVLNAGIPPSQAAPVTPPETGTAPVLNAGIPSVIQIKAALSTVIKPAGKNATTKAIAKTGAYVFSFNAPGAGTLVIDGSRPFTANRSS
jgi:sugar lactone lactonase YvrE